MSKLKPSKELVKLNESIKEAIKKLQEMISDIKKQT